MAEQFQTTAPDLRRQIDDEGDGLGPIEAEIGKRKALEWLVAEVNLVDEEGNTVDRGEMELPDLTEAESDEASDSVTVDQDQPQTEDNQEQDDEK